MRSILITNTNTNTDTGKNEWVPDYMTPNLYKYSSSDEVKCKWADVDPKDLLPSMSMPCSGCAANCKRRPRIVC